MTNEELIKEYQEGNHYALDELIIQNEKIVKFFANKYYGIASRALVDFDDLVQEGWIAFIKIERNLKLMKIEFDEKQIAESIINDLKRHNLLGNTQNVTVIYNAESQDILYTVSEVAELVKCNLAYIYSLT